MASVKPRGAGQWLMIWRAPNPKTGQPAQRTKMFSGSRGDALRTAHEIEAAQRRDPVQSSHNTRVSTFLHDWQAWRAAAGNVSEKTLYRDGQHIKNIAAILGDCALATLGARDLDRLTARLRQRGYAVSTICNTWAVAKKALRQARRWKLIAGMPWEDATVPPQPQTAVQPPTVAETLLLADLLEPDQPIAAMLMRSVVMTGARKGELLALLWSDVDFARGAIAIRRAVWEAGGRYGLKDQPKTAASRRHIALPAEGLERLHAYRAWMRERQLESGRSWNPDDLVFPAYHGGLWRPSRATAIVGRVARKHGLKTGLHNRRHTHAVILMEAQVPIKVVADRLGHANPAMTLRVYQHLTEQASALAVAALDKALTASGEAPANNAVSSDETRVVD
jgi:integrase